MPSKKKKYNARFPAGRIKKIMQTDEEVGKVAQAVPVIISRTLELFVESLLTKSMQITQARNAKTLTPSHMKQCILSESRFDFLKDLVKNIPDASAQEDNENNLLFDSSIESRDSKSSTSINLQDPRPQTSQSSAPHEQSTSRKTSTVIRYGPSVTQNSELATSSSTSRRKESTSSSSSNRKRRHPSTVQSIVAEDETESDEDTDIIPALPQSPSTMPKLSVDNVPPLIPISSNFYLQNRSDSLVIDEDYDN